MRTRTSLTKTRRRRSEGGYILVALMLAVTLLVIFALVAAQTMAFEVKRDREEEMVHRGVQYARAVGKYYKKFGNYPPSLDALENTQNLRFLRKRYKDPLNRDKDGKEQDFKLLRITDVPGLGAVAALGAALQAGALGQNGALGQGGALGQNAGALAQNAQLAAASLANQAVAGTANTNNPFGSLNSNANQGQSQNQGQGQGDASQGGEGNPNSPDTPNANGGQGSDNGTNPNPNGNSPFVSASGQATGATFGGAGVVGVVSANKKESIRVYAKKNHYNDWKFIYDPSNTKGIITGPVQPGQQQGGIGQPVQNGFGNPANPNQSSPFSNSNGPGASPFGQSNPQNNMNPAGNNPQN